MLKKRARLEIGGRTSKTMMTMMEELGIIIQHLMDLIHRLKSLGQGEKIIKRISAIYCRDLKTIFIYFLAPQKVERSPHKKQLDVVGDIQKQYDLSWIYEESFPLHAKSSARARIQFSDQHEAGSVGSKNYG